MVAIGALDIEVALRGGDARRDAALEPVPALIEHTRPLILARELHEVHALRAPARSDAATRERERELRAVLAVAQDTGCHGHAARRARELGA